MNDEEISNQKRALLVAKAFHGHYERLAPQFGYATRKSSAVPWAEVPAQNKALMVATVRELIRDGLIDISGSGHACA